MFAVTSIARLGIGTVYQSSSLAMSDNRTSPDPAKL